MDKYKQLKEELVKIENLANNKVLEKNELDEFLDKLKKIESDDIEDEIIKRKFKKQQNKINTIWTDSHGNIGIGNILIEWKDILEEIIGLHGTIEQVYFGAGSAEEIIKQLELLIGIGKKIVNIIDPYLDNKILDILGKRNNIEIKILTKTDKLNADNMRKIKAFSEFFENNKIEVGKIDDTHDRFYIIDGVVYSLGTSLQNPKKGTLFSPLQTTEGKKVIDNFNSHWATCEKISI